MLNCSFQEISTGIMIPKVKFRYIVLQIAPSRPMLEQLNHINELIIEGELQEAAISLRNIFSLSGSDYAQDVIILLSQFKKLQSEKRRGIISYEQQNLTHNQIVDGLLSLVKEIQLNETDYQSFQQVEQNIVAASQKFNIELPFAFRQSLINRLGRIKALDIDYTLLWIDDNPHYNQQEQQIIEAIGAKVLIATSSQQALQMLQSPHNIELILSDIGRDNNKKEGLDFVKRLFASSIELPTIFYTLYRDRKKGLPAYTFGLATRPDELLHLVMDVIERKY